MALVNSTSLKGQEDTNMADQKTASEDITVENNAGQTVVVVPAGQPVPDNVDDLKKQAELGVVAQAPDGQDNAPVTEDKAARSSKGK